MWLMTKARIVKGHSHICRFLLHLQEFVVERHEAEAELDTLSSCAYDDTCNCTLEAKAAVDTNSIASSQVSEFANNMHMQITKLRPQAPSARHTPV